MILCPEAESCLHECKTRVVVIALCELLVELEVESLELLAAPVREVCCPALALTLHFFISWPSLDIVRNRTLLTYISVTEANHNLVAARSSLFKKFVHRCPVIYALRLTYIVVKHIRVLELDIVSIYLAVGVPKNDTCHRLNVLDFALERYALEVSIFTLLRRCACECSGYGCDVQYLFHS